MLGIPKKVRGCVIVKKTNTDEIISYRFYAKPKDLNRICEIFNMPKRDMELLERYFIKNKFITFREQARETMEEHFIFRPVKIYYED